MAQTDEDREATRKRFDEIVAEDMAFQRDLILRHAQFSARRDAWLLWRAVSPGTYIVQN